MHCAKYLCKDQRLCRIRMCRKVVLCMSIYIYALSLDTGNTWTERIVATVATELPWQGFSDISQSEKWPGICCCGAKWQKQIADSCQPAWAEVSSAFWIHSSIIIDFLGCWITACRAAAKDTHAQGSCDTSASLQIHVINQLKKRRVTIYLYWDCNSC